MGVQFSSSYTQRQYYYMQWKTAQKARGGIPQTDSSDGVYQKVWFYDGPEIHYCLMWLAGNPVTDPNYTQQQNDSDLEDFTANILPTCNGAIVAVLPDGRVRIASEKSTITRTTLYSFDWTDPTTWFTTATYVPGETATDQGSHTAYSLAHQNIIDSYHGKLTGEDYLVDSNNVSYRVVVSVNGAQKTEQDPHFGTGGDYTINYATGVITFLSANQPTDVVTCNYHYMVDSTFIVAPTPGTNLLIDSAEVSFTTDVGITDSVVFQPYGFVDVFAPQLMPGVPSGTKIPLGSPTVYKTIGDYHNDATKAYPTYPAMGGATWRGLSQPMIVMAWDYQSSTSLLSQAGMEVRIWLQHHTPFTGTFGTATFYCIATTP